MTATRHSEVAEPLLTYLTEARWFAGKGRRPELGRVTVLPWVTEPGSWPAVRFEVVEVSYPDEAQAATELYQLALSYRPSPDEALQHAEIGSFANTELGSVVGYDAMQDPAACRAVLTRLIESRTFASDGAETRFRLTSGEALNADLPPRMFGGQQSNTSVMFGDVAMLKLFRRLEIGRNLDIEVHESLSRSGVADVAQLYGWVEADWRDPDGQQQSADLAMVVEKLADARDGWELALDELRAGHDFTLLAADLGRALAEIHTALRAAFPSAEVSGADTAEVMTGRLEAASRIAPALREHASRLSACFGALADATLVTQRVHGDFHLGQTLHTPTGWKIIDFEGEPVKSLAERSEPDSIWRDVAGMLRSFDYAAASVPGPDSRAWADACRTAFLDGYAGGALTAIETAQLRAYEADKAVYEVVYEVRNRPSWLNIPLAAVAAIASQAPGSATGSPGTDPAPETAAPADAAPAASSTASAPAAQAKE